MTKAELIEALRSVPNDATVVIDVDSAQCISDRNVLDVSEVRYDEVSDTERWAFIQAIGTGAIVQSLPRFDSNEATWEIAPG